ncbi:MAG: squalene/phytoene synthase family protein [Gammaproteobacteria bacterium]
MLTESPATPVREFVLRFAPEALRPTAAALFTVERELAATARDGLDHSVAHARLDWWDEELERLAVAAPRHPATRALAAAAAAARRSPPDLRSLVEATRIEVARVAFLDRAEFDAYLAHWSGSVFRTLALAGMPGDDPRNAEAERFVATAGPVLREIELLAAVTRHALAGRVFVPLGDPPAPHTPWTREPLDSAEAERLRSRLLDLRSTLRSAAAALHTSSRPALAAPLVWSALALRTTAACDAALPGIPQPARFEPLRRNLLAWRTAVAVARGRLPHGLATGTGPHPEDPA